MNGSHEFDQKKCQTNGDIILFERTSNRIFTCKNVYLSLYQTEVLAFSVKKLPTQVSPGGYSMPQGYCTVEGPPDSPRRRKKDAHDALTHLSSHNK